MNFDFKKPEISFKRVIAMLLAVILCAGQVNLSAFAKTVIRTDETGTVTIVGDGEEYQKGDISGDASGNAGKDAYPGESVRFSWDDALCYTEFESYNGNEWEWLDGDSIQQDLTVKLYKSGEVLKTLTKEDDEYVLTIEDSDFLSNYYYQVRYKDKEIGTVDCSLTKGLGWNAYAKDYDSEEGMNLLPGEDINLEVVVEGRGSNTSIDTSEFTYQWKKLVENDDMDAASGYEDISGETSPTYYAGKSPEGCGHYVCEVKRGEEQKTVYFSVYKDSGLEVSAVNGDRRYVKEGEGTRLQVEAHSRIPGVTIKSYQWYKNEEPIEGATSDTLIVDKVMKDSSYSCKVTDSNGSTNSTWIEVYLSKPLEAKYSIQATELKLNQPVDVNTNKDAYLAYPFTPKTSGWYTFYSEGDGDSKAYILDVKGNILAYNDDDGSEYNFKMNVELTGGQTYYLAVAHINYGEIFVKVVAACGNHTKTAVRNAKAATCDSAGYTGDTYCTNCGELVSAGSAIAAKGHSYGAWAVTKAATVLAAGEETRSCSVCGAKETREIAKTPAKVSVNYKTIPLKVKQSTTAIKVAFTKGDGIASWKSSNTKVATVNKNGKIIGKKNGTAKITITLKSGKKAVVTVKVQKKAVTTKKIKVNSKSIKLKKGKKFQLKTTVIPVTSKQKITYKSSNKKIATVTGKGKITAKKKGKATITVKSGKKSIKVKVTVK